jgi:FtsH-binding integral membrane protein
VAIPGALAIVGLLLLVVQMVFGGALNTAMHDDSPFVLMPLVWGLSCLAIAFVVGLAKGPAAVRLAMLLGFGSLALFGYAIMAIYTSYFSRPVFLASSAGLFAFAVTLLIFAYTNERPTNDGSSVRG